MMRIGRRRGRPRDAAQAGGANDLKKSGLSFPWFSIGLEARGQAAGGL